jgi:hypothetical protein
MGHESVIEAGRTEGQYRRVLFRHRELFFFSPGGMCSFATKKTVTRILSRRGVRFHHARFCFHFWMNG